MHVSDKVRNWLNGAGKIWLFRISIFLAILATILTELQILKLDTETILLFVLSLLLVFAEIFLEEISSVRSAIHDGLQVEGHEMDESIKADASKAKSVTLIVRSGGSRYYLLQDIIVEKRNKFNLQLITGCIFTRSLSLLGYARDSKHAIIWKYC